MLVRIRLEQAPLGSTRAIRFFHDGEHTLACELAGLTVVRTRAGADVEVGDADSYLVGKVGCGGLLRGRRSSALLRSRALHRAVGRIAQVNPASTGFELAPAVRDLGDGEYALAGLTPYRAVHGRQTAVVQVIDQDAHLERCRRESRIAAGIRLSCRRMDDDLFQEEVDKEEVLAEAKEKYGSRGKAQAERIYQQTQALFAGGQLSEEDRSAFRDLMIDLFFETKEEAKKYTPKKFRSENSAV